MKKFILAFGVIALTSAAQAQEPTTINTTLFSEPANIQMLSSQEMQDTKAGRITGNEILDIINAHLPDCGDRTNCGGPVGRAIAEIGAVGDRGDSIPDLP